MLSEIKQHIVRLASRNAEERIAAMNALDKAIIAGHSTLLRKAGGIAALVRLLNDSLSSVRASAANALSFASISDRWTCKKFCKAGGISLLVRLLSDDDSWVQYEAISALGRLTDGNAANQEEIRKAGGISQLIGFLSDEDYLVNDSAATVLGHLVKNNEKNQEEIRKAGVISMLFRLLNDQDEYKYEYKRKLAIHALGQVTQYATNHKGNRKDEVISQLVCLLSDKDETAREEAVEALGNIAQHAMCQEEIRKAGVVLQLIHLLSNKGEGVRKQAVRALGRAVQHVTDQEEISKVEIISHLVRLSDKDETVRAEAAIAFDDIAQHAMNQEEIRKAGVISQLINLLSNKDKQVRRNAVRALCRTAQHTMNQEEIRKAEGILKLIRLLSDEDADVRNTAALALGHMAQHATNQEEIRKAGGIQQLLRLLTDESKWVRKYAAWALGHVAQDAMSHGEIRKVGGISQLFHLLSDESECGQGDAAALVLGYMTKNNVTNQEEIYKAGIIVRLIHILSYEGDVMKSEAMEALGCMAENNAANQEEIRNAGGITQLFRLLNDEDKEVRGKAKKALSYVTENNIMNQEEVRKAGDIPQLFRMLDNEDEEVRGEATRTLCSVAQHEMNQEELRNAGGISRLVHLLNDEDEDVRGAATRALGNMAQHAINEEEIRKAGGIPLLVRFLSNEDEEVRKDAVAALSNFSLSNFDNQDIIRNNGMLVLEQLRLDANHEIRLCAETIISSCQPILQELVDSQQRELEKLAVDTEFFTPLDVIREELLAQANTILVASNSFLGMGRGAFFRAMKRELYLLSIYFLNHPSLQAFKAYKKFIQENQAVYHPRTSNGGKYSHAILTKTSFAFNDTHESIENAYPESKQSIFSCIGEQPILPFNDATGLMLLLSLPHLTAGELEGMNRKIDGFTVLHRIVVHAETPIALLCILALMDCGANVNLTGQGWLNGLDLDGQSPIHSAKRFYKIKFFTALTHGAILEGVTLPQNETDRKIAKENAMLAEEKRMEEQSFFCNNKKRSESVMPYKKEVPVTSTGTLNNTDITTRETDKQKKNIDIKERSTVYAKNSIQQSPKDTVASSNNAKDQNDQKHNVNIHAEIKINAAISTENFVDPFAMATKPGNKNHNSNAMLNLSAGDVQNTIDSMANNEQSFFANTRFSQRIENYVDPFENAVNSSHNFINSRAVPHISGEVFQDPFASLADNARALSTNIFTNQRFDELVDPFTNAINNNQDFINSNRLLHVSEEHVQDSLSPIADNADAFFRNATGNFHLENFEEVLNDGLEHVGNAFENLDDFADKIFPF